MKQRSIEENRFCNKINRRKKDLISHNETSASFCQKQLHNGEQYLTKWSCSAFSISFEENRFSNKINRRKKLENRINILQWDKYVILPKKKLHKGNRILQNETAQHTTQCKIGLIYVSHCVLAKMWKTDFFVSRSVTQNF